jgi:dUTP pyrophosphatase
MHLMELSIAVVMCNRSELVKVPAYETAGAAGMDLQADILEAINLHPGHRVLVPTGVKIAVPQMFEMQVRPRSGLALKHGLSIVNSPGTIDSDYRGEIGIVLINHGADIYRVEPGARIAQMVLSPVTRAVMNVTEQLDTTVRGENGYGSTGTSKPS